MLVHISHVSLLRLNLWNVFSKHTLCAMFFQHLTCASVWMCSQCHRTRDFYIRLKLWQLVRQMLVILIIIILKTRDILQGCWRGQCLCKVTLSVAPRSDHVPSIWRQAGSVAWHAHQHPVCHQGSAAVEALPGTVSGHHLRLRLPRNVQTGTTQNEITHILIIVVSSWLEMLIDQIIMFLFPGSKKAVALQPGLCPLTQMPPPFWAAHIHRAGSRRPRSAGADEPTARGQRGRFVYLIHEYRK